MSSMFKNATSFNQPLNKWNVSNVTNMSSMFEGNTLMTDERKPSAENYKKYINNVLPMIYTAKEGVFTIGKTKLPTVVSKLIYEHGVDSEKAKELAEHDERIGNTINEIQYKRMKKEIAAMQQEDKNIKSTSKGSNRSKGSNGNKGGSKRRIKKYSRRSKKKY